jgi:1,2-beta-oligoglucan phosphorylase
MSPPSTKIRLSSESGLQADFNANGSLRRFDCGAIALALFVGNELEGSPTNLYLRRHSRSGLEWTELLGPRSPTRFRLDAGRLVGTGEWFGIEYSVALVLARSTPVWFWHVSFTNRGSTAQPVDLTYTQDLALAPYGAVRLNEYYVSQYLDHTPLPHPTRGIAIASRQNLAADGRHPWCLIGALRQGTTFATDGLQFHGLDTRAGKAPTGLVADLPGRRLQHEHALVAVRGARVQLEPNGSATAGFFGAYVADHPGATSHSDLDRVGQLLELPEASPVTTSSGPRPDGSLPADATLFSSAPALGTRDLGVEELRTLFGPRWRHEELDDHGNLLSFFHGADRHVVLRAKELRVLRPHGHILRSGLHTTPDETALTSTVWMGGVFHSMLTQGHVNINRLLSTVHSYLGLFRSHGQRVFVEIGGTWRLLDIPSAFEMTPEACHWVYRHETGVIQVRSEARSDPHELVLCIAVTEGGPLRFLISHHVSLNGDDGSDPGEAHWHREGNEIVVVPAPGTGLAERFPEGAFRLSVSSGTELERAGGDELLFSDGRSREQPYLCLLTAPTRLAGLSIRGHLVPETQIPPLRVASVADLIPRPSVVASSAAPIGSQVARLIDIVPWFAHNALVHYLSPRGLEQYSGGGWGTRDVCQGPVEMLLALGAVEPVRDILLRVMKEQNPDGDWPQWFTFFERERNIRAGDSHGDIIFWPLVVLGQYLLASGDASVLDEPVPFFDSRGPDAGERATVWQHVERALSVIEKRLIPGTSLAAYGHGDWNDSLQPADPAMRDHMCSAWTVTLHFQMLTTLARALRSIGREREAVRFESLAPQVQRDFQHLLIVDGTLAGYAVFDQGHASYLLHPSDGRTGVRYSSLAMIHAIIEDMLTPAQTREHLQIIDTHLSGPDGVRLFDKPMPYHGGVERLFQRAETATFFGREIGLMYMHAHLRYAQALAHVGEAERFFHALCQANPLGIRSLVSSATLRQANCYYSSSDAAFDDRYQASVEYRRVMQGTIALDGGWRVYSSGAGIALGLIARRFLGISCEAATLHVDPVIPPALDGLRVEMSLLGHRTEVAYRIKGSGCGVHGVTLNGHSLPFTTAANPHRHGGAAIARAAVMQHLAAGANTLIVEVG